MAAKCPQLDAAIAQGALRYSTGKPCKHGHAAERITANRTCVECVRLTARRTNATEAHRVSHKAHRTNYPDRERARKVARIAAELRAMPSWASKRYIALFYRLAREEAKRTGLNVHVDHIVPLRSRLVCGLHCEFNLQLLPGPLNQRKSNVHWPESPNG